ncbi:hypothetical protein B0O99DRAFT_673987 [Bisporella sp. PMI_857]|nr:hypothetical protein B0O99DRAFT_673987 [Bisporella sp. PMI_857]
MGVSYISTILAWRRFVDVCAQIYEVWEAGSLCEALPYQHPTDFVVKQCVGCNLYNPLLYAAIDGLSVPVPSKKAVEAFRAVGASGSKPASRFGPPVQINSSDGRQRVINESVKETKRIEAEKARKALFENTDNEIEVVGSEMETNTYKKKEKEIVKRSHSAEARIRSINNTRKLKPQSVEESILSLSVSV